MARGTHTRAGVLIELVTLWQTVLEQAMPEGLHSGKMTHIGTVWEELLPVGWTYVREVCGVVSCTGAREGLLLEQWQEQWLMMN